MKARPQRRVWVLGCASSNTGRALLTLAGYSNRQGRTKRAEEMDYPSGHRLVLKISEVCPESRSQEV